MIIHRHITLLALLLISLCANQLAAQDWIHDAAHFSAGRLEGLTLNADKDLALTDSADATERQGTFTSPVQDTQTGIAFIAWISNEPPKTQLAVEFRAAADAFDMNATSPAWVPVRNGQVGDLPAGRYVQYRVMFSSPKSDVTPTLREIFLSTQTLRDRYADRARPALPDLTMSMMYQATLYKLCSQYKSLPYDASERGMYILRERKDEPIVAGRYNYQPMPGEMYLPARFGTWVVMRIHPTATFSDRTLRPADTVLRTRAGQEKNGPLAPHRAVNFFDEHFMQEYLTGVAAAVRYYREHNPFVLGYNIMPPEFFYDTEPWPDMTYMGGFGDLAFRDYQSFMRRLGITVTGWPSAPANAISTDRNYYLWAYWRNWAAARYIASVARVVRENDPRALVGTLCYTGDQALRGIEPAFIENNPDFDFYYSSTMFPRVPGPDGLTGGTIFSYTRPITVGQSRKINLLEYDLWSPYVDLTRAQTYARYARIDHVVPAPIVFGEFPNAGASSNHLTKYHGMKGEPLTPDVLATLARNVRETLPLRHEIKQSDVAVVLPSFSLYAGLEANNWKVLRSTRLNLHILQPLLRAGVTFDVLTEGQMTADILNRYKLVIVQSVALYPWQRAALDKTRANLLLIGLAGSVSAPGPHEVNVQDLSSADLTLRTLWPTQSAAASAASETLVPGPVKVTVSSAGHPLVAGLPADLGTYHAAALNQVASPYISASRGDKLLQDAQGRSVYSVYKDGSRFILRFGLPLYYVDDSGKDTFLLSDAVTARWFGNILTWCGAEHFADLGALRVVTTDRHRLIENTAATAYDGPIPQPVGREKGNSPTIHIPGYQSILVPMP